MQTADPNAAFASTAMGLCNARLSSRSPRQRDLAAVAVDALADRCSVHLCIPEHARRGRESQQPNIATSIVK
jgi:hypothetical protein